MVVVQLTIHQNGVFGPIFLLFFINFSRKKFNINIILIFDVPNLLLKF